MKIFDLGLTAGGALHTIFSPWKPEVVAYNSKVPVEDQLYGTDLLLFSGGTDVNPELYNHENVASGEPDRERDSREKEFYHAARNYRIPMVGVCRGSQFLCVMNGGWLVQDVDNHAGYDHDVYLADFDRVIRTNSTHHQLAIPPKEADIIGGTRNRITRWKYDTKWMHLFKHPQEETEITWYPRTRGLGFQFHPEYYPVNHQVPKMVRELVNRYLDFGFNHENF